MRIFVFLLVFLCSICCCSQIYDDFSDGDFTHNPTWNGDAAKFKVDAKKQLRLTDTDKTCEAYLSTAFSLSGGTEWSFYVHLLFNSSSNNYAIFYLTSSEPDLSGEGYMVMIGGKDDNLRLLKYKGETTEVLIEGFAGRINISSPELNIKADCDEKGNWSLYSQLLGSDDSYVEEGSATDTGPSASAYLGVKCIYTASRSSAFIFDDIRVRRIGASDEPEVPDNPEEPDTPDLNDKFPPRLQSVSVATKSSVSVLFDEAVNVSLSQFSIEGVGMAKEKRQSSDKKSLTLIFDFEFKDSEAYTLLLDRVKDRAGNYMPDTQVAFTYYDPALETLTFGDVVFNEIMANPTNVPGLPETEYIELYNRTGRPVSLNGWKFHYGNKAYKLTDGSISADGYVVLCQEKKIALWKDAEIIPVGVKSFPELANSGKLLWLEDARNNLIAWVEYSDEWYADAFKKKGGFSLECIDINNRTNDAANWSASTDASGGTPGKGNSIKGECADEAIAEIVYVYLPAPDTLTVKFSKPMLSASLAVVDNYTVYSGNVSIKQASPAIPDSREVSITLSDSLIVGNVLEIEMEHLKDISGFDLAGDNTVRVGIPEDAVSGDVLFNEILFNPRSGGNDYVELYNCSAKYINLHHLFFASRNENGEPGEGVLLSDLPRTLAPGEYLCFSKDIAALQEQYICEAHHLFPIGKLPSLPDDKGNVLLLNRSEEIIDEIGYTEKMHTAFLRDKEGVALEKIHPQMLSDVLGNWVSASTASGGGTPGYINSQYRELSDGGSDGFRLEQSSFSPNGDGADDELIVSYHILDTDVQADVSVYDASGRLVRDLAKSYLLQSQGVFVWDGKESNGILARMGLYIIYVETYTPSGKKEHYKMGCALTG